MLTINVEGPLQEGIIVCAMKLYGERLVRFEEAVEKKGLVPLISPAEMRREFLKLDSQLDGLRLEIKNSWR